MDNLPMPSPQTLSEADRRIVAGWAADCAERVLALFEAEAPADGRPRDAIARARAFARGELDVAEEISWQLRHMAAPVAVALRRLPPVGDNASGPLGQGLLASGHLGSIVRELQSGLTAGASRE